MDPSVHFHTTASPRVDNGLTGTDCLIEMVCSAGLGLHLATHEIIALRHGAPHACIVWAEHHRTAVVEEGVVVKASVDKHPVNNTRLKNRLREVLHSTDIVGLRFNILVNKKKYIYITTEPEQSSCQDWPTFCT